MLPNIKQLIEDLGEDNELQAYMLHAAMQHVVSIVKFFHMTRQQFSPEITRIIMSLHETIPNGGNIEQIFTLYAELVNVCSKHDFDITSMPIKAMGKQIP